MFLFHFANVSTYGAVIISIFVQNNATILFLKSVNISSTIFRLKNVTFPAQVIIYSYFLNNQIAKSKQIKYK